MLKNLNPRSHWSHFSENTNMDYSEGYSDEETFNHGNTDIVCPFDFFDNESPPPTAAGRRNNGTYVWDGTIPCDLINFDQLKSFFNTECSKWTFQKEKAASGLVHYQCRVSWKQKRRSTNGFIPGHWSQTSKGAMNDFSRYVTKCETRVEGPWSDKDEVELPDDWLEGIDAPLSWQQEVIDKCKLKGNGRVVNIIVDPQGGIGKTTLAELLIKEIPHVYYLDVGTNRRDLKLEVASYLKGLGSHIYLKKTLTFVIDVPRADEMKPEMWATIERIKGRNVSETRYATTVIRFMIPHVWVFVNAIPDRKYLSADRWKLWGVNTNTMKLVELDDDIQ